MQDASSKVVLANGGQVIGSVRVPLAASDFSSFLLQAQSSGADVLGLANAGADTQNSLKAAQEFGLTKTMKPAALLAFLTDIHGSGSRRRRACILTDAGTGTATTRAAPSRSASSTRPEGADLNQAAYYSATLHFLNAVKEVGTTDPDKVMAQMKADKMNDMFAKGGYIRADGLLVHDMSVMQVKTPAEFEGRMGSLQAAQGDQGRGRLRADHRPLPLGPEDLTTMRPGPQPGRFRACMQNAVTETPSPPLRGERAGVRWVEEPHLTLPTASPRAPSLSPLPRGEGALTR